MQKFKEEAMQSKRQTENTGDRTHMDKFLTDKVNQYQSKLVKDKIETCQRQLQTNTFSKEEKKSLLLTISELKRQQDYLLKIIESSKSSEI